MKGLYFYRGEAITRYGGGWFARSGDLNIYSTIDDAKNAIDKYLGGYSTGRIPKRHDKPINIIGVFKEE